MRLTGLVVGLPEGRLDGNCVGGLVSPIKVGRGVGWMDGMAEGGIGEGLAVVEADG